MHRFVAATALLSALALAATVSADDLGGLGTIAGLQVNNSSADTYLQFHGRVYVKNGNGGLDEYRWGGTSCGSRILTDAEVEALHRGLDNKSMRIEPVTQPGQGQTVCLVGFTLVPKASLKLGIP
jgi:hypothetical protein